MCRSIRPLFNFEPPASPEEIRAAALQYVRKVSGATRPSRANAEAFERAVDAVTLATLQLLGGLASSAPARSREEVAAKARLRGQRRAVARAGS